MKSMVFPFKISLLYLKHACPEIDDCSLILRFVISCPRWLSIHKTSSYTRRNGQLPKSRTKTFVR
jgi:hypothetical protein